jgi:hypothetical protein
MQAQAATISGDTTTAAQVVVDTGIDCLSY